MGVDGYISRTPLQTSPRGHPHTLAHAIASHIHHSCTHPTHMTPGHTGSAVMTWPIGIATGNSMIVAHRGAW